MNSTMDIPVGQLQPNGMCWLSSALQMCFSPSPLFSVCVSPKLRHAGRACALNTALHVVTGTPAHVESMNPFPPRGSRRQSCGL